MKKFCLVSFCNMYMCPYAKDYIKLILESGCECDILYWDRDAMNGATDVLDERCKKIVFQHKMAGEVKKTVKLAGYFGAIRFIRTVLQKTDYDGLFFLQTHVAAACWDLLVKKFQGKYIVDIRDYTLEDYRFYRLIEQRIITNSYTTVISSPAYKRFLPQYDYDIVHNYLPFDEIEINTISEKAKWHFGEKIVISFVGTVRFFEIDKKILDLFKNDDRYQINYFGTGSDVLKKYCIENGIYNAEFRGRFSPGETIDFYRQTKAINNLYGNHDKYLDYALSNKLYHSAQLQIPILVCPDTYMEEITTKYNLGFVVDVDNPNAPDELYSEFLNFNYELMRKGSEEFLSTVVADNRKYHYVCERFIQGKDKSK